MTVGNTWLMNNDVASKFVGHQVRVFREDRRLSQAALAEAMDISQGHLSLLETGSRTWSVEMACAAASALAVDVRLLMPRRPQVRTGAAERAAG